MKRLFTLIGQDWVLVWRNGHGFVVIGIAALMVLLVVFLPDSVRTAARASVLDALPGNPVTRLSPEGIDVYTDETAFEESLAGPDRFGIRFTGSLEETRIGFVLPYEVPPHRLAELETTATLIVDTLRAMNGTPPNGTAADPQARAGDSAGPSAPDGEAAAERLGIAVRTLRGLREPIALNLKGIPVFLAFEVAILGFLLAAVFMLQEKAQNTVRAYRVSPGSAGVYVFSKTIVFVALAVLYSVVVTAAGFGFAAQWGWVLLFVVWASAFMTLAGLGMAVWYRNLSHWFFPGLAVLVLNILPVASYLIPSFSPVWMRAIPSYSLVFALEEALFPTGNSGILVRAFATGSAWTAAAAVFAYASVKFKLMREG